MLTLRERDSGAIVESGSMGTPQTAQINAYQQAISASFPFIVEGLVSVIGRRLTAYIASVKDARAIDRWLSGTLPQGDSETRLRLAYRVVTMIAREDSSAVVKAWLLGLNPNLDDNVPILLLRDGNLPEDGKRVVGAAMAFAKGG